MLERYDPRNWPISYDGLIHTLIVLGGAVVIALIAHWIIFAILRRLARASESTLDDVVVETVRRPLRWAAIAFAITAAAENDALVGRGWDLFAKFLTPAVIGWVAYAVVRGLARGYEAQIGEADDPVAQRGRLTRIAILSRTVKVGIIIITVSLIMLNIPGVRDVGTTMLASAGLAALAVGAAAQPALKSLIAGLQMAITQPLRIGDLVKVDDQAGRVEEIRMSFVTVRTWDERVLVVPTMRFLDESFENWSRVDEKLTGPVMLNLDPIADIEPIRAEFERFVQAHPLWDGRNLQLLMTEAYPESVELRLSMSAETIGDLWTLRCAVREHMLGWLKTNQPEALIRHRLEVEAANARAADGG
ncbi:MAG: mechanosensitive ion channel [Erythrobacter sp.]|jgi:small-conductance mechanosensitive channel|uniref:mechanosensitive ion channel family protein n=1 Tax=Qipengyuania citrea TaxID=225971 RepID=UPI001A509492|nr:mechanosensitive ion channel domain-containing protein [Qipengyuania citrea]MBL4717777.1 mechanosensitive ion channel [Erythrobacter sp.]MCP2018382.1 small-conductance mechanosensitive channel [Qipengyuania citrea]MDE0901693.1 mechanosensitive ion channel [Erythrobacter sp.]